jgi:hypothetical protein
LAQVLLELFVVRNVDRASFARTSIGAARTKLAPFADVGIESNRMAKFKGFGLATRASNELVAYIDVEVDLGEHAVSLLTFQGRQMISPLRSSTSCTKGLAMYPRSMYSASIVTSCRSMSS